MDYRIVLDRTLGSLLIKDAGLRVYQGDLEKIGSFRRPIYRGVLVENGGLIDEDRIVAASIYIRSLGADVCCQYVRPVSRPA